LGQKLPQNQQTAIPACLNSSQIYLKFYYIVMLSKNIVISANYKM
jgi:hypothetical protein